MKRTYFFVLILGMLLPAASQASDHIRWSGYARNYTGLLTGGDQDFSILQNTLNLELSGRGSRTAFLVNPYMYHYFDDELELGVREAYLSMYFDHIDIRIGKQQIIYGKAEGVFITDVVSPKDMREFLLPDFDEIRMGVTAFRLNYYTGMHTFELSWIPVFTPTKEPGPESIWRPEMPFPVKPVLDESAREVSARVDNSEVFFRYSVLGSSLDLELVGGYFWDDDPALHLTPHLNPGSGEPDSLTVRPGHHRLMMGGGSFSLPVGGLVLRGEAAYYGGKYFQGTDPDISGGLLEKNYLHYMAGMDLTSGGWTLNAQFIQEYILNHEEAIRQDELIHTLTLMARKDYFREKLRVALFSYIGLNNGDALLRPSVSYDFADGFEVLFGVNLFLGDKGRFGQFSDNDMLYTKIRYSF